MNDGPLVGPPDGLEKLKQLVMPPLRGKSFLDVRCAEGLACGFAIHDGAVRVVGLEPDAAALARAKARFPHADLRQQGWEQLPDGPFDVILLSSALHLAQDPQELVSRLVGLLEDHGTLVLELAVARRKIKENPYGLGLPTMPELAQLFRGSAWKHMGSSLATGDETVRWQVVHLRKRRPFAYLLLQPPAYGKSTIARELFTPAGVRVVSGDKTIALVAKGELEAPSALAAIIRVDYSNTTIDRTIHRVFEAGLGPDLIRFLLEQGGGSDFALDAFLPAEVHAEVESMARESGFVPVKLQWETPHKGPAGLKSMLTRVDAFAEALTAAGLTFTPSFRPAGRIDRIVPRKNSSIIRGWAIDERGQLPPHFSVSVGGKAFVPKQVHVRAREDVQGKLGLPHADVGFELRLPTIVDLETTEIRCGATPESLGPPLGRSAKALR